MRATAMLFLALVPIPGSLLSRKRGVPQGAPTHPGSSPYLRRRQKDVLLQPVDLRLADIFADLLVELSPGLPRPVFHQLGRHARADAGNEQKFLALAGVQVDLHEGLDIELACLVGGELLVEQELVEL